MERVRQPSTVQQPWAKEGKRARAQAAMEVKAASQSLGGSFGEGEWPAILEKFETHSTKSQMLPLKKASAWKKNRKLGVVMGGRTHPKIADRVFNRKHNLTAPAEGTVLPIFITGNPSRDFYFPISTDDVKAALDRLPS